MTLSKHAAALTLSLTVTAITFATACRHMVESASAVKEASPSSPLVKNVFGRFAEPDSGKKIAFNLQINPAKMQLKVDLAIPGAALAAAELSRAQPCTDDAASLECVYSDEVVGTSFTLRYLKADAVYRVSALQWQGKAVDASSIVSHTSTPDTILD